jgi:hypothetical protein
MFLEIKYWYSWRCSYEHFTLFNNQRELFYQLLTSEAIGRKKLFHLVSYKWSYLGWTRCSIKQCLTTFFISQRMQFTTFLNSGCNSLLSSSHKGCNSKSLINTTSAPSVAYVEESFFCWIVEESKSFWGSKGGDVICDSFMVSTPPEKAYQTNHKFDSSQIVLILTTL